MTVETNKTYGEVVKEVEKVLEAHNVSAEITPLAIYQPENVKHISIHLEFKEKIDDKLMEKLEKIS